MRRLVGTMHHSITVSVCLYRDVWELLLLLPPTPLSQPSLLLLLLWPPLDQAQISTMPPLNNPVMLLRHDAAWVSSLTLL